MAIRTPESVEACRWCQSRAFGDRLKQIGLAARRRPRSPAVPEVESVGRRAAARRRYEDRCVVAPSPTEDVKVGYFYRRSVLCSAVITVESAVRRGVGGRTARPRGEQQQGLVHRPPPIAPRAAHRRSSRRAPPIAAQGRAARRVRSPAVGPPTTRRVTAGDKDATQSSSSMNRRHAEPRSRAPGRCRRLASVSSLASGKKKTTGPRAPAASSAPWWLPRLLQRSPNTRRRWARSARARGPAPAPVRDAARRERTEDGSPRRRAKRQDGAAPTIAGARRGAKGGRSETAARRQAARARAARREGFPRRSATRSASWHVRPRRRAHDAAGVSGAVRAPEVAVQGLGDPSPVRRETPRCRSTVAAAGGALRVRHEAVASADDGVDPRCCRVDGARTPLPRRGRRAAGGRP